MYHRYAALQAGGMAAANAAEKEERNRQRAEKEAAQERNFRAFEQMMRDGADEKRRREEELRAGGTTSGSPSAAAATATTTAGINTFSGEPILDAEESESVAAARAERRSRILSPPGDAAETEDIAAVVRADEQGTRLTIVDTADDEEEDDSVPALQTDDEEYKAGSGGEGSGETRVYAPVAPPQAAAGAPVEDEAVAAAVAHPQSTDKFAEAKAKAALKAAELAKQTEVAGGGEKWSSLLSAARAPESQAKAAAQAVTSQTDVDELD